MDTRIKVLKLPRSILRVQIPKENIFLMKSAAIALYIITLTMVRLLMQYE
jgi:hypothetical protein